MKYRNKEINTDGLVTPEDFNIVSKADSLEELIWDINDKLNDRSGEDISENSNANVQVEIDNNWEEELYEFACEAFKEIGWSHVAWKHSQYDETAEYGKEGDECVTFTFYFFKNNETMRL